LLGAIANQKKKQNIHGCIDKGTSVPSRKGTPGIKKRWDMYATTVYGGLLETERESAKGDKGVGHFARPAQGMVAGGCHEFAGSCKTFRHGYLSIS